MYCRAHLETVGFLRILDFGSEKATVQIRDLGADRLDPVSCVQALLTFSCGFLHWRRGPLYLCFKRSLADGR